MAADAEITGCRHTSALFAHIVRFNGRQHASIDTSLELFFEHDTKVVDDSAPNLARWPGPAPEGRDALWKVVNATRGTDGYLAALLESGGVMWLYDSTLAATIFASEYPQIQPWHVWKVLAAAYGNLSFSESDVGLRLEVWWSGNNRFYSGIISSFECTDADVDAGRAGTHTITLVKRCTDSLYYFCGA